MGVAAHMGCPAVLNLFPLSHHFHDVKNDSRIVTACGHLFTLPVARMLPPCGLVLTGAAACQDLPINSEMLRKVQHYQKRAGQQEYTFGDCAMMLPEFVSNGLETNGHRRSSRKMKKSGLRKGAGGGGGGDVMEMEQKLAQLKMQMEVERQRRAELMSKTGSRGSFWRSGGDGALRGPGVRLAVKPKARENVEIHRPTSSDASREETPTDEEEIQAQRYLHSNNAAEEEEDRPPSPPSSPEPEHGHGGQQQQRRSVPEGAVRSVTLRNGAQPGGKEAPVPAVAPMAMECQTDAPPPLEWKIPTSRPQSARTMTYMEKIIAGRKAAGLTPR
jgi:hypothetical protein